ncbi:MAG: hypothetical protein Q8N65_01330, partial [bacterium]|nr:hypothetical protein [bacterium]
MIGIYRSSGDDLLPGFWSGSDVRFLSPKFGFLPPPEFYGKRSSPVLKGNNDTRRDIKGNDAHDLLTPWSGELIYFNEGEIKMAFEAIRERDRGIPLCLRIFPVALLASAIFSALPLR